MASQTFRRCELPAASGNDLHLLEGQYRKGKEPKSASLLQEITDTEGQRRLYGFHKALADSLADAFPSALQHSVFLT